MARKQNPDQLKLFMSANEWKNDITRSADQELQVHNDNGTPKPKREPMDEMWNRKLGESMSDDELEHGAGVFTSIADKGYQHDIEHPHRQPMVFVDKTTGEKQQGEGHHRIAAAAHIENLSKQQFFIPTNYVPAHLPKRDGPADRT